MTATIEHVPAAQRFHTKIDWLESWHSFSFGDHYDPKNTHHGLLLVSNDDWVAPGRGFLPHPHRDMEIVTWVLEGTVEHRDSEGNHGLITPGLAQRMSAGTGIRHSETNPSPEEPVHLIQMWVPPAEKGLAPSYEQAEVGAALDSGMLIPIASGREPDAVLRIHQPGATLWVARVPAAGSVMIPHSPFVHVFVAGGSATAPTVALVAGDALRLTDAPEFELTAGPDGCELLVWDLLL